MNKEKLIIFTLVAFVSYHLFLKERFEVQKTNCSLYPIESLCESYKTKGCAVNPNKVMGDDQDFCICADPSKGCDSNGKDKIKIAYDKLLNAYEEYQKDPSKRQAWENAWKEFQKVNNGM